jgi:hypothetical protein
LPEALNDAQYLVPRLSRDQLRETIEGPIALAGANISSELTDRLLNDTGDNPDMLPLLQHALARLWEESKDKNISLVHYQAVGEMNDALNRDADRAFAQLKDSRKEAIVRRVFQRLVEPGAKDEETRKPTRLSELALVCTEHPQTVCDSLQPFADRGFIAYSEDADPLVDISHESLIRQWKRLKAWVEEVVKSASTYRQLAYAGNNGWGLYRGANLKEARTWQKTTAPNFKWATRYGALPTDYKNAMEFLEQSKSRKHLLGRIALIFTLASTYAVALSLFPLPRCEGPKAHRKLPSPRRGVSTQIIERRSALAITFYRG